MRADSARISPTADYTSHVWYRHGLSHEALTSRRGALLYAALRPMNLAYAWLGRRPNLDMMLLARHRVLDHLLARAIETGEVAQVLEVAAGLSPRGLRFARRYPNLVYVEGDLPAQAARKRSALAGANLRGANHEIVALDALAEAGESSLAAVCAARFDPARGTAIVTEGLLGYFDRPAVLGMWRRFAFCLSKFPRGLYLSDLNLGGDVAGMRAARAFRLVLGAFARGQVHLHWDEASAARDALLRAGFAEAEIHRPQDLPVDVPGRERGHFVRVVEARAQRARP